MARDEGKKVNGTRGVRSKSMESSPNKSGGSPPRLVCTMSGPGVNIYEDPRTRLHDLVSKEETAAAYVYKMDKTWLLAGEVTVEIRRGHALWLIGKGDESVKVELPRNSKMRVREATASMSPEGVLTVVIPKRQRARNWYEFTDLVFLWFKTVHVGISS